MTLMEKLIADQQAEQDTDVSLRARVNNNILGKKLFDIYDYGNSVVDDIKDTSGNEKIDDGRKQKAWDDMLQVDQEKQVFSELIYDANKDEYINMSPSKMTASDLLYTKKKLEEEAKADSKTLYDAHYGDNNVNKIGVAAKDFNHRHPVGKAMGAIVEEEKMLRANQFEYQAKNYLTNQNANAYGDKTNTARDGKGPNFLDLGLDAGKSEVFKMVKLEQTLPDIAAAIDTAESPEEKAVLKHRFDMLQERTLKNRYQNSQMEFLKNKRATVEKVDETNGGQFSPKGFGDFKEALLADPKLMKAYEDQYNREDTTGDLAGKAQSMKATMLQEYMGEKSNQLQEAAEDLVLSKNESAISSDLLGIFRASDLTAGQATNAVANSVFDPVNLVPVALGAKISKIGTKIAGKVGSMFGAKSAPKIVKASLLGAAGGGIQTGAEDAMRQQTDVNAQYKDEIDLGQTATATAIGAGLGATIVGALAGTSLGINKLLKSKNIEKSSTPEEVFSILSEVKKENELLPSEIAELDNYGSDVMRFKEKEKEKSNKSDALDAHIAGLEAQGILTQAEIAAHKKEALSQEQPVEKDWFPNSREKPELKTNEAELVAEVDAAAVAKPKVPIAEEKEKEQIVQEEVKKKTGKITVIDKSGKEIELDFGTTEQKINTPIANLTEEARAPMAQSFIYGKNRMKKVGDDTSVTGDIPMHPSQQIHSNARSIDQMAADIGYRTVEQAVENSDTPEGAIDKIMKSYNLWKRSSATDIDKLVSDKVSEMEHRLLAIEGMKAHYNKNNINGDFTNLIKEKDRLLEDIKEASQTDKNMQIEFDTKAELGEKKLSTPELKAEIDAVVETVETHKIDGVSKEKLKLFIEKVTNYSRFRSMSERIKIDGQDIVTEHDRKRVSPVLAKMKEILNAKDSKDEPLSSSRVRTRLVNEMPEVLNDLMQGANDNISKAIELKLLKEYDEAIGTKRIAGIITKVKEKQKKSKEGSAPTGVPKDTAKEILINEWKSHNKNKGQELIKAKKSIETGKFKNTDDMRNDKVKFEIYKMLAKDNISTIDRLELEEALVHNQPHDGELSPIELTKQKKEKFIERKNNDKSKNIFNQELKAKSITQLTSARELIDAVSQVAQIVGVFFGDINLFRAIGATKDSEGNDYREIIGEKLQKRGIISKTIEDVKAIIKVPTRNFTYLEGRPTAIKGMMTKLGIDRHDATRIYDGIMDELGRSDAAGLKKFADVISENVANGNIPAKFVIELPSGRKVPIKAEEDIETNYKYAGVARTMKHKSDVARPGAIAANIVQSLDSYIKDTIIMKMTDSDIITAHDGFSLKTDAQKIEATKIYIKTLKEIYDKDYFNTMMHKITNGKAKKIKQEVIDWDQIVPEKLLSPEFSRGKVDVHEIRKNMSLNSDRLLNEIEMLSSLLNASDPTGKTGFNGMRHSIVRYLSKSSENQNNPVTYMSEMDDFVSTVMSANSVPTMEKKVDAWKKDWMKSNNAKPSPEANKAFTELSNMIRATTESITEFDGVKLVKQQGIFNEYSTLYYKNLHKMQDEQARVNETLSKNVGKEITIEKIFEDAKPEDIPELMNIIKEKVEVENSKDIPTIAQEKQMIEANGKKFIEDSKIDEETKNTFDESYRDIRMVNNDRKRIESTVANASYGIVKSLTKLFQSRNIDRRLFKENILDTGFRHIRGMTKDQAKAFKQLPHIKETYKMYKDYINAKARAHTNPNERYGYFRNNILALVMEKEQLTPEAAAVRANAILKLSALKNMNESIWKYTEKENSLDTINKYLDNIDMWDTVAREEVFSSGKLNFNDSYLATVRGKGEKIDLEMESESFKVENNTLGKIIDDEATLKVINSTPNLEGYMETNKIRKVGQKFYRILINKNAEEQIKAADPLDILSKTIFTTMAKVAKNDDHRETRKLIKDSNIFHSNKPTKDDRVLTRKNKKFLSDLSGMKIEDIKATHYNEYLGRQIFGKEIYEPLGAKFQEFSAELTKEFKYNAVPINPNSGINGAFYSVASVMGRYPIRGAGAIKKAVKELSHYKKLDQQVDMFLQKADIKNYKKAVEQRDNTLVGRAISEGMSINALDGIRLTQSMIDTIVERAAGKDTKKANAIRTILLRPHTPIAKELIAFFSLSDSIGRTASYILLKGSKHDTDVGAGVKSNYTFGDMSHVSSKAIESLDTFLLTAFTKWGERTLTEILKLPLTQQITLAATSVAITAYAKEYDIEDKGFNVGRAAIEIIDDFAVAPFENLYNKYTGHNSIYEDSIRTIASVYLPAEYNKLLMSYMFDERNGSVADKISKLILTPTGKNWGDTRNGTRQRSDGTIGPLADFDARAWWEDMLLDNSVVTPEQFRAGEWRKPIKEKLLEIQEYLKKVNMW